MPDQTPLTDAELEQIRADYDGVDEYDAVPRLLAEVDRLRAEAQDERQLREAYQQAAEIGVETIKGLRAENAALAAKLDAADARIAELEELKCSVCGLRVAHLNTNGYVIGWGCANGDNCKDDRLVQARAAGWDEGYKSGVEDERTSEANIGIAGFGMKVNPARVNPYRSPAPESPRPPAEEAGDE